MSENLKKLGIAEPSTIEKYALRHEEDHDVLKIYYRKDKGEFFARSEKFKFPRERKRITVDSGSSKIEDYFEISPKLTAVVDELDGLFERVTVPVDLKKKILKDLRHLEKVVANKINEIERDLETLTKQ